MSLFASIIYVWAWVWWIVLIVVGGYVFSRLWMKFRQRAWVSKIEWVNLSIDIPKENIRPPFAAEQIFAGIYGIMHGRNVVEQYWEGQIQEWISCEIIGVGGEVRFVIRCPKYFRNVMEAQVYAQYPEAEIREMDDYVNLTPEDVTRGDHDLWGTELKLLKPDAYPIRTYVSFEKQVSLEEKIVDPAAAVTEVMSNLKPGEQMWIQILVQPVDDAWKKEGEKEIKKVIGAAVEKRKPSLVQQEIGDFTRRLAEAPFKVPTEAEKAGKEEGGWPTMMQFLSPSERNVAEVIGSNISKVGFNTKIRFIYIAKKELFSKSQRVSAMMGAINQFTIQDLNGFTPDKLTKTAADYILVNTRLNTKKRKILKNYKLRNLDKPLFVLNIEELATAFHPPVATVKAPQMIKTKTRKAQPPAGLPTV